MTPCNKVFDIFLASVMEDEWGEWEQEDAERDMMSLLKLAKGWFKFPRNSIDIEGDSFKGDLTNEEIVILASYMKVEWLSRTILSWENVKPLYTERDFSQANLLEKLAKTLDATRKTAMKLESNYYRSRNGSPFDYTRLAGGND